MPFQTKAAPSSRVNKSSGVRKAALKKAFPFARHQRAKPFIQRSPASKDLEAVETLHHEPLNNGRARQSAVRGSVDPPLPDVGPSRYVAKTTAVSNVIQAIQYVQNTMFSDIPDTRSGMNSTRIAQVLNFRRALPPIVSVAHVHVLLDAPTKVEREIVELVQDGRVRRLLIPGRGSSAAGLGDCLVLVEDWEMLVRNSAELEDKLKEKFIKVLQSITKMAAVPSGFFTPEESSSLVRAGFLVSASSLAKETTINPSLPYEPLMATPGSTRTDNSDTTSTGAQADSSRTTSTGTDQAFRDHSMFLSLPNMGPYLRLLGCGRSHMCTLLKKSSYGEVPLSLLKDRWDGSIESDSTFAQAKRARGEFSGVLPGRTKKWKDLYGMNFRWALEEALGAGIIEIFDTGSVGPGVRQV